ncbi:sodium-dependent noradrenaline transporter-like [Galendromus occidentalis]|uniref:Transporter n=1 Tax=Galendromus occidentalis TaxID=34638 RepID=A0AAJ6VV82_9ACAR|nr:sodium-dependent noradrenaline transporter-like [Galendromus occidentalis]
MKDHSIVTPSQEDTSETEMDTPPSKAGKIAKKKLRRLTKDDGYCSYTSTPISCDTAAIERLSGSGSHTQVVLVGNSLSNAAGRDEHSPTERNSIHSKEDGDRPQWQSKADFLLSIIGFAVDLANVWRFPYLCYKNGGGVFLIPYTLMLLFGALPLFYMELVIGQYNRSGPISVWNMCPLFKGVGYCAVLISWYVSFYYNVIIGWAIYFVISSFSSELPWSTCGNPWNTPTCYSGAKEAGIAAENRTSAALEFFNRGVLELHTSSGMHDLGVPKWQLVVCVFFVFCILYVALCKGVNSSGKVVWFTATAPYVILTILLIRGVFLPGADEGVLYYLRPDVSKLYDSKVWVDAAVQVFFSVGVGFGVHLTYASYNPFTNNCYKDCLMTACVNSGTSFYSGFVIFVYLGYMAKKQGVPIDKVATEGHGLVFQVYPEAISTLPGAPFWSVLFFVMLLTLGLDSAMGGLESVITGLMDEFKFRIGRWKIPRELFTVFVLCASFSMSMINVTRGGGYMVTWFDTYAAGISLLCSALFEALAVSWVYGLDRFSGDIQQMLGITPGFFWRGCWKFVSPLFLVIVIISAIFGSGPVEYNDYIYPPWTEAIGWAFALSSVAMIPIIASYKLYNARGSLKERIRITTQPIRDENHPGTIREKQRNPVVEL